MGRITQLERKGNKIIKVYLEGRYVFSLSREVVLREGLYIGQNLLPERESLLKQTDDLIRCLSAASRYLGYRPHSELELRTKLHRRGFEPKTVDTALNKLKDQGLVDDAAFTEFWQHTRQSLNPRSQRMTCLELKRKGIDPELISKLVKSDDVGSAYQIAIKKAASLPRSEKREWRQKLGGFLRRRGFSYEVIDSTLERIWNEQPGDQVSKLHTLPCGHQDQKVNYGN